jgi:phage/plasmid-like protein (TIGR03299 family)
MTTENIPTVSTPAWEAAGIPAKGQRFKTGADLVAALGLDWEIAVEPLMNMRTKEIMPFGIRETYRTDTGQTLGVVKKRYTAVQNAQAFGFLPEVAGTHGLEVVSAGALNGGAKVWVLTKFGEKAFPDRILKNGETDAIHQYLLFNTTHDGSGSCHIASIAHAFWCANALASAWQGADTKWAVHHTRSAPQRLAEAMVMVASAKQWSDNFLGEMEALEAERCDSQTMRRIAEQVMEDTRGAIDKTRDLGTRADGSPREDVSANIRERRVECIVKLFEGEGKACRGETKLDAYQALTEYIDHHRARAQRGGDEVKQALSRMNETYFGYNSMRLRKASLTRVRSA